MNSHDKIITIINWGMYVKWDLSQKVKVQKEDKWLKEDKSFFLTLNHFQFWENHVI